MSGRRRPDDAPLGLARNKHGTPLYSRHDIREQYCINDKELRALETKRKPFFGCLVAPTPQVPSSHAPTKRRSLMPACLRSRAPSDESVYFRSHCALSGSKSAGQARCRADYDDEPFCRRRPNTICYTDPKRLASLDSNLNGRGSSLRLSGEPCVNRQPRPLGGLPTQEAQPQTGPLGLQGHLTEANKIAAGLSNTELLPLGAKPLSHHSADFLNGHTTEHSPRNGDARRASSTQPNTPETCHQSRVHPLHDAFLDDRRRAPKHVSFQKGMSRSTTFSDAPDDATAVEKIETMFATDPVTTTRLMRDGSVRSTGGIGETTSTTCVRTQDASTGSSSGHRTHDAASGPSSSGVKTQDVSIGPSGVRTQDAATGAGCSSTSLCTARTHERLLGNRSPDLLTQQQQQQLALDRLLAPVLTKALLKEKLKRSSMRTQATQTDQVQPLQTMGKSLPQLDLYSTADDKMVSQAAQTISNGDFDPHRRLVKSLSEAANPDVARYDMYDTDRLAPPVRYQNDVRMQRVPSFDLAEDEYSLSPHDLKGLSESSDVFLSDSSSRCKKSALHKTMSEGEILQEKKRALILSSGFVDVDINGYTGSEEDIIEPHCVDECSIDLSHSRIFSQESLNDEEELEEESFHENMLADDSAPTSSEGRRISIVSSDSDMKSIDANELKEESHLQSQLDIISAEVPPTLEEESPDVSPIETSSFHETLDACEESVSESQVTVVPRRLNLGGSGQLIASDSENGNCVLSEHPGKTLCVKQSSLYGSSFEEDEESSRLRVPASKTSTSNLSNISDEQTSLTDFLTPDGCIAPVSPSTSSSECDKAIASSTDDYGSVVSGDSSTVKSDGFDHDGEDPDLIIEENYMERLVQELKSSDFSPSKLLSRLESRKMTSPESDSSSSHFTEQETSKATNTVNSKSDLSRSTSQFVTDQSQSENSDDYMSAVEFVNSICDRSRTLMEERHVSSPPRMEDIVEVESIATPKILSPASCLSRKDAVEGLDNVNSDFETAHDLTSPLSDTTTSASYQISEEFDRTKPVIPPKSINAFISKPVLPPKPERFSPCRESKERPLVLSAEKAVTTKQVAGPVLKAAQGSWTQPGSTNTDGSETESQRVDSQSSTRYFDVESNTTEDSADIQGDGEDSDSETQHDLWSEEEREKLKSGMKLEFSSGGPMFGDTSQHWGKDIKDHDLKKLKIFENKSRKLAKLDSSDSSKVLQESKSQSPKDLKISRSPSTATEKKSHKDKPKSKTPDEVGTPGMVRSPAMHEGFRVQDWTPVRTPGTPDKTIDFDTSDDSGTDHSPRLSKVRSPNRLLKDQRKKTKDASRKSEDFNLPKTSNSTSNARNAGFYPHCQERSDSLDMKTSPTPWQEPRPSSSIPTYRRDSLMHDSPIPADLEPNYGSGHQLNEKNEPHVALCAQCGERPASREGNLRSTPSPQQMLAMAQAAHRQQFSHQFYVMQKSPSLQHTFPPDMSMSSIPRPRPLPPRARSEERSALNRDWRYTGHSLEWGDVPRQAGEDDERGVHSEAYRASPWLLLAAWDELRVWRKDSGPCAVPIPPHVRIKGFDSDEDPADDLAAPEGGTCRRGSGDSTCSEKDFRRKYQAVTHRLVHRKASIEMFRRLANNTFQSDRTVYVSRESGEFGFRIHGSRPVVVSAIETDTPAETSGLEVGDIVLSINDVSVLEASHSEVVKLAHSGGCDTLKLEVARTCNLLAPLITTDPTPVCAGYLYKLGAAHRAPGSSAITRRWHRRWFALTKDHCLYHYKCEGDPHPLGAVVLRGHTVHAFSTASRPYAFTVSVGGEVGLQLAAHTAEARGRWGHVITQASEQAAQRDELLEASARRVQQAPGSIAAPDCFGFLHKLGARWHQWKKRYCVLKDACLYLYHDTDATQAIGVVYLHGYRVQSTSIGGKKHAFELLPPESKFRHFYFHAESDYDKKRWLAAFEYSIDRWIKLA